jgi:hypothetical protein
MLLRMVLSNRIRNWSKDSTAAANHDRLAEAEATSGPKPQVTGDGILGENQPTHDRSFADVKQGWVPAFVGSEVVRRKAHAPLAAMAVRREIDQSLVTTMNDAVPHERGRQHSVATLTRNVVDAVNSAEDIADQKATPLIGLGDAGGQHRSVFVEVTREQVSGEPIP